jgi:predicted ribosomally synthesized peptide with SipW-like signal peptide
MDRRLVRGGLAALAALALGVGGTTLAAFDDFTDVPGNEVGAGVMLLDLDAAGSATTAVTLAGLVPGATVHRLMWVARNDSSSAPDGTLSLTLHGLIDSAAPCDTSRGKALAEIAAGVPGCLVDGDAVSGTPAQGNLSRVLEVAVSYGAADDDPARCVPATAASLPTTGRGNLNTLARDAGTAIPLGGAAAPLVLAPGHGVCVALDVSWPQTDTAPDRGHPGDTAAEGDSLTVGLRFDLVQVQP